MLANRLEGINVLRSPEDKRYQSRADCAVRDRDEMVRKVATPLEGFGVVKTGGKENAGNWGNDVPSHWIWGRATTSSCCCREQQLSSPICAGQPPAPAAAWDNRTFTFGTTTVPDWPPTAARSSRPKTNPGDAQPPPAFVGLSAAAGDSSEQDVAKRARTQNDTPSPATRARDKRALIHPPD